MFRKKKKKKKIDDGVQHTSTLRGGVGRERGERKVGFFCVCESALKFGIFCSLFLFSCSTYVQKLRILSLSLLFISHTIHFMLREKEDEEESRKEKLSEFFERISAISKYGNFQLQ